MLSLTSCQRRCLLRGGSSVSRPNEMRAVVVLTEYLSVGRPERINAARRHSGGLGRRLRELSQPAWAPRSLGGSLVEYFFEPQLFKKEISHQAPESRVLDL
jgi:hypothetical protein